MTVLETTEDPRPFRALRRTWQPVANSRDIANGNVVEATLLGVDLAIARLPSGPAAIANACPHRGARFGLGRITDDGFECPYHGWTFAADGQCTGIPSLGGACRQAEKTSIDGYPTIERYGMIWVLLESPAIAPLPDVPEFENPDWNYVVAEPMDFGCGFRREVENYLDMAHFAFAHQTTLGKAAQPVVDHYEIHSEEDGFRMEAEFPCLAGSDGEVSKLQQGHHRSQYCHLPNFTTIRQSWADGDERVLVHIPSPISPTSCRVFWGLAISPNFAGPPPEDQVRFAVDVLDEDRIMCENQRPLEVPFQESGSMVVAADRLAMTYQRRFRQWTLANLEAALV